MVAVCFFPSGCAVLSGIGGREAQGSVISLCIPVTFLIGGGAIPMVIGGVGDYYSPAAGFIGTGCFITFVAAAAFWIGQKRALFQ